MQVSELVIKGAKQNNLKNIDLRLPHNKVIAVTGVSGSGKSSLAFETIFAEGQWRFVESLSTYARLFLEKMDRPQVDEMTGIRPAIALEQRNPVRGSRSTVGTLTELYDFYRLLYSKAATPICPKCGKPIRRWSASEVSAELVSKHAGQKAVITFPSDEPISALRQRGFSRAWIDGGLRELADITEAKHPLDMLLDRLIIADEPRLGDSIETAWRHGHGRVKVIIIDGPELVFSSAHACEACGITLPEPTPILFSFNHPVGACKSCKGFGNVLEYSEGLIVPDPYLSLSEGAIEVWEKPSLSWWKDQMVKGAKASGLDIKRPYRELPAEQKRLIFEGTKEFYGLDDFFEDLEGKRYKLHVRVFLSRYRSAVICPECGGKRLSKEALAYKLGGLDIADMGGLSVKDSVKFFKKLRLADFQQKAASELLTQINMKLEFLERVGLGYIGLSRQGKTLSGGEYQRVNLSNQLASRLTGTLYVLDEPTVGLHARDTERVTKIMKELSEAGNTIVVVEHDRSVIESADWVAEIGPGGGDKGGEVVFSGTKEDFMASDALTARYLRGELALEYKPMKRASKKKLVLRGASGNNLQDATLSIPLGTMTAVTGVSGSGKSTLVINTLYRALARHFKLEPETPLAYKKLEGAGHLSGVKLVDQEPIGKSPRSNPVTYLKIFDHIRKLYSEQPVAKAQGYGPGFFSFNVPGGRCEACKGDGYEKVEMYFFEDLFIQCEECGGRRYRNEALKVKYKGRDINDVLHMTVREAMEFFSDKPRIKSKLKLMKDMGLGYLRLGQPATKLSGGEAQRLKICAELGFRTTGHVLYIFDEPTVGLHMKDIDALLIMLGRLVEAGNTVVVIEHNLDLVRFADWVIDLGPEGGDKGGEIIFEGTPEALSRSKKSYTGKYLKSLIS